MLTISSTTLTLDISKKPWAIPPKPFSPGVPVISSPEALVGLDGTVSVIQAGDGTPSEIGNIQLARFADVAVTQRLGSDVAMLNGMMHIILKNNWQAQSYIEERCEEFEAFKAVVEAYTPDKVEAITGIAQSDL